MVLLDQTGGLPTERSRIVTVPMRPPRRLPGGFEPLAEWFLLGEVRRVAREHAVDVVHATRLGMAPRGERLVITAWDPIVSPLGRFRAAGWRGEDPTTEAMYAVVDAVAARRAATIVAVTPAVEQGLDRLGRCELIPAFIPDEAIGPTKPVRRRDVVMVAGVLDLERKGLDLALEAVGRVHETLEDVRLVLVGDWRDRGRAGSLPDLCEARGRLAQGELRAALEAGGCGCCLIPSLWEEFGYSGLEALAAGIPVACTPLPAYEGLGGGGVFMTESRDAGQLAGQILAALGARDFEFPAECRASTAIPRIVDTYEETTARVLP